MDFNVSLTLKVPEELSSTVEKLERNNKLGLFLSNLLVLYLNERNSNSSSTNDSTKKAETFKKSNEYDKSSESGANNGKTLGDTEDVMDILKLLVSIKSDLIDLKASGINASSSIDYLQLTKILESSKSITSTSTALNNTTTINKNEAGQISESEYETPVVKMVNLSSSTDKKKNNNEDKAKKLERLRKLKGGS